MKNLVKPWLTPVPWASVVAINASLCQARKALHKLGRSGLRPEKVMPESGFQGGEGGEEVMGLEDVADVGTAELVAAGF